MQKITTFLTYDGQAEEAVQLYTSVFPQSKLTHASRGPDGKLFSASFELFGQTFIALNGGPQFGFAMGTSLFVSCETQAELDGYWERLTADGGQGQPCGWLKDKFGLSWQIIPTTLGRLLQGSDKARAGRVMQAMLKMSKLDIAALESA